MDRSKEKNQSDGMQLISNVAVDESPLSIPESLLEEAGIDKDADLDVVCRKGSITITEADEPDILVPKAILNLCEEFGISPEKVKTIMRREGLYEKR